MAFLRTFQWAFFASLWVSYSPVTRSVPGSVVNPLRLLGESFRLSSGRLAVLQPVLEIVLVYGPPEHVLADLAEGVDLHVPGVAGVPDAAGRDPAAAGRFFECEEYR